MEKFMSKIGYAFEHTVPDQPSVWVTDIVEKNRQLEVVSRSRSINNNASVNMNEDVTMEVTMLSDAFSLHNYFAIRYITYCGAKWTVKSAIPVWPRIKLSIGGIYNEQSNT